MRHVWKSAQVGRNSPCKVKGAEGVCLWVQRQSRGMWWEGWTGQRGERHVLGGKDRACCGEQRLGEMLGDRSGAHGHPGHQWGKPVPGVEKSVTGGQTLDASEGGQEQVSWQIQWGAP